MARVVHATRNTLTKRNQYNPYLIRKYNRWYQIKEYMHASTLKVDQGYIVYNAIYNPNNPLQWYWNTNTKDYLWDYVVASIS